LGCISKDLSGELTRLRTPSSETYESVCANTLRLLERLLRDIRDSRGWKYRDQSIDLLIRGLNQTGSAPREVIQLLELVAKPYRDYVLHGYSLAPTVSKVTLAAALEAILRLGDTFSDGSAGMLK
jgi:hypothetical protein